MCCFHQLAFFSFSEIMVDDVIKFSIQNHKLGTLRNTEETNRCVHFAFGVLSVCIFHYTKVLYKW